MSARKAQIDRIIADLEELRPDAEETELYAVDENIGFFRASRHLPTLLAWLIGRRRGLDSARMLELADFDLPQWQIVLQRELARMSSRRFPGLIEPLVKMLVEETLRTCAQQEIVTVISLGAGSMEVEAQLFDRIGDLRERVRMIGCDNAPSTRTSATENLALHGYSLAAIDSEELTGLTGGLYLYEGDGLAFLRVQPPSSADIVFHSRFIHHVPVKERSELEDALSRAGGVAVEYDDYQCLASLLGPVMTAWRSPVLLNGAILSQVRGRRRKAIEQSAGDGSSLSFFNPPGSRAPRGTLFSSGGGGTPPPSFDLAPSGREATPRCPASTRRVCCHKRIRVRVGPSCSAAACTRAMMVRVDIVRLRPPLPGWDSRGLCQIRLRADED